MTMQELAASYFAAADLLTPSIHRLAEEKAQASDPHAQMRLGRQLRVLREMHRDAMATGRYLQHYYDHREEI